MPGGVRGFTLTMVEVKDRNLLGMGVKICQQMEKMQQVWASRAKGRSFDPFLEDGHSLHLHGMNVI